VGDSAAAASAWAWLAADPRTAPAAPDSAGRRLGAWMTRPAYRDAVATARRALADEVLATAIRQPLRERIVLQTEDGSPVPLQQRQGARLTVVAFISRHCAPSLDDLASLDSVAQRLKADGIPTIAVVNEKPTAAVRNAYARRGWTGALHFDADGSASRGFRQNGTPAYYIVATEDATARFLARQGRDLLLQAAALAGR